MNKSNKTVTNTGDYSAATNTGFRSAATFKQMEEATKTDIIQ